MEHQALEELSARETLGQFLARIVFDAEGDDPLAVAKDVLFRDHTAIEVAAKVDQSLLSSPNCLAVNHPFLRHSLHGLQAKCLHPIKDFGTKDLGEIVLRKEIVSRLAAPFTSILVNHSSRHNHVNMRVILKLSVMGMQHGMSTDLALELGVAAGKTIDCLLGTSDQ